MCILFKHKLAFNGIVFLQKKKLTHSFIFSVVVAEDNTGVIAASVVAAALVLIAFVGVTIYCFYR